jgi:hypothetical protein
MAAPESQEEPIRLPPAMTVVVAILRDRGHSVDLRRDRNGSIRYRVDGDRERNALQVCNRFSHYGI